MKNIKKIITACTAIFVFAAIYSCKKEVPTVEDNFLNYEIPDVPATKNYTVGAFYYTFSSWNANIKEKASAGGTGGTYFYNNGVPTLSTGSAPAIMDAHVANAATGGIDYFIFTMRSPTLDNNAFKTDSNTVVSFLNATNASKMNFAISYSINLGLLGVSNNVTLESNASRLQSFYNDFKRLSYWMTKANYQKINGKYILILNNSYNLNSADHVALYKQVRANLSALGFELYLVGQQPQWSPPQRFFYRFQNCVDAMYESNMTESAGNNDRYWKFAQFCDQNWAYWKTTIESWNAEFIPSVMPGYNYQINNPTNPGLSFQRNDGGAFYKTFTDIAKRNASKSGLIFVDSFNNFTIDSQIEPTQAYGSLYLDITRKAFKIN